MSLGQLGRFKPFLKMNGPQSIDIGYAIDLPRTVGKGLQTAQEKKIKHLLLGCYDVFGSLMDGSPLGCNAECIVFR